MKAIHEIREMICDELDKIAEHGELTAGSLDTVDKLTHSLKSIDTIVAMDGGEYSHDNRPYYDSGNSYARRKRDSMGRYSRDGMRGGYSRESSKEYMISELEEMLSDTNNEKMKSAIRKCINELERN